MQVLITFIIIKVKSVNKGSIRIKLTNLINYTLNCLLSTIISLSNNFYFY